MAIDTGKLTAFLQALIRERSLPGEEQAVVQRIEAEMRGLGYDRIFVDENGSLIGVIEGDQPGPTLLFDGHCDTVGVSGGAGWQYDPFGGEIRDGRMYGRGTSDMKGPLAAMIYAAAAVDRQRLTGRVVVSASVLEELMEGVALRTVMEHVQPDFVVIGESTELNLNHGGRGRAELILESTGKPAHSSTPHLGVNAVHLMLPAIAALERMPLSSDPLLGPAILALTDIISDPYPAESVVPSRCRVSYDRRLIAGETIESVLEGIRALPELQGIRVDIAEGAYRTYTGAQLGGVKFFPAWKTPVEHPFVQAALAGLRAAGLSPGPGAYGFCTNATYSAGWAGAPTIGFGPSAEGQAHVTDEYIELDQLQATAAGFLGIMQSVLG